MFSWFKRKKPPVAGSAGGPPPARGAGASAGASAGGPSASSPPDNSLTNALLAAHLMTASDDGTRYARITVESAPAAATEPPAAPTRAAGTCETCRFWGAPTGTNGYEWMTGHRRCALAVLEDGGADAPAPAAFVDACNARAAYLMTSGAFGCNRHEPTPEGQS